MLTAKKSECDWRLFCTCGLKIEPLGVGKLHMHRMWQKFKTKGKFKWCYNTSKVYCIAPKSRMNAS